MSQPRAHVGLWGLRLLHPTLTPTHHPSIHPQACKKEYLRETKPAKPTHMAATPVLLLRQVLRRSRGTSSSSILIMHARPSTVSSLFFLCHRTLVTTTAASSSSTTSTSTSSTSPPPPSPPPPVDWPTLLEEKKTWAEAANGEAMLIQDLRSDHAGETGAVYIYKGALAAMRLGSAGGRFSAAARDFVQTHHDTEAQHLVYFDRLLDASMKSKLLPLWRLSGWGLGFFPTVLFGEQALFVTVEAVESFVEVHYLEQIYPLECRGAYPALVALLKHCCEEEIHHKEDAQARWLKDGERRPWYARAWAQVVEKGSQGAVAVCKRI